jgi:U3 small nucleolar RNA-associated protein 20
VIAAIDIENLDLLDKIFSLLSFAMKYLLKQIKDDIVNVYDVYFELIRHKNKYVRKFASQSLCYVLRKVSFDQTLIEMLLAPMVADEDSTTIYEQKHAIYGMSDLLFEVVSGQNNELHSKARSVIG